MAIPKNKHLWPEKGVIYIGRGFNREWTKINETPPKNSLLAAHTRSFNVFTYGKQQYLVSRKRGTKLEWL
jgi:hypothetical protein